MEMLWELFDMFLMSHSFPLGINSDPFGELK